MAIVRSRCDRFAESHFRYSGVGGYILEGDMEKFERELRTFEQGRRDEEWLTI
jgi:hypothetical protein